MFNVNEIYDEINGYNGVCYPQKDGNGNWVLHESCLTDFAFAGIAEQISACPQIPLTPIPSPIQ